MLYTIRTSLPPTPPYPTSLTTTNSLLLQEARDDLEAARAEAEAAAREIEAMASVRPTKLYARNKAVDEYNNDELEKLNEQLITFRARDAGQERYLNQLKQGLKAPEVLNLAIGAQVMLLKNLEVAKGLVNGARGVVIGFSPGEGYSTMFPKLPTVRFIAVTGDKKVAT